MPSYLFASVKKRKERKEGVRERRSSTGCFLIRFPEKKKKKGEKGVRGQRLFFFKKKKKGQGFSPTEEKEEGNGSRPEPLSP